MSALENAKKMSQEEVLKKIKALDIQEYGIYRMKLSERLCAARKESREEGAGSGVVAALNNADTDYVLLEVLKADPEKIMNGIAVAAYALGTQKKKLYIPECAADLAESLADLAAEYHVEIQKGIVNVRAEKGCALLHIVTAEDIADAFCDDYEPKMYISVNGKKLKRVSGDMKISDLADVSNAKALLLGYQYCKRCDPHLNRKGLYCSRNGEKAAGCKTEKLRQVCILQGRIDPASIYAQRDY